MEVVIENLDLLFSGLAISASVILGFTVFYSQPDHATNKRFLLLTLATALWGFYNYFLYQINEPDLALWILRFQAFFAVIQAYFIFEFFSVFPNKTHDASPFTRFAIRPVTAFVAFLTLTPAVFSEVTSLAPGGGVLDVEQKPLFILFALTSSLLVISAAIVYVYKFRTLSGEYHKPLVLIGGGAGLTFSMIIAFNMVFPAALNIPDFVPYGAAFFLPLVGGMTLAILRHRLLDVKVAVAQILILFLLMFLLFKTMVATDRTEWTFGVVALIGTLIVGIFLIRSVINEIKTREKVEILASDLQAANERLKELDRQKSEFVSIASHQLRSPITAIQGYVSLVLEGDFGRLTKKMREPLERVKESARLMAKSIEDYLNISRIEQGRMKYEMDTFNLTELAETVVNEYTPVAEGKDLKLVYESTGEASVCADVGKIKQVIANLVDNAIKYTPEGKVEVHTSTKKEMARIEVKDSGVGIPPDDINDLFNKFVRARGANKINTSGTGLGLYVAKQMVEAHEGNIWAESEGKGKGSTFVVEIPLFSQAN